MFHALESRAFSISPLCFSKSPCIYPLTCYNKGDERSITNRDKRVYMSESQPKTKKRRQVKYTWQPTTIRALREHMGLTQREMADELEVRQQTISEWETGLHTPHRSTQKTLSMVAERAGFRYEDSLNPQERAAE
jgi:DNA-binding transcriptional regulator YiaG